MSATPSLLPFPKGEVNLVQGEGPPTNPNNFPSSDRANLREDEIFWRDHQPWLEKRGYMLRARYQPGWVASWKATGRGWWESEDGLLTYVSQRFILVFRSAVAEVACCSVQASSMLYEYPMARWSS